MEPPVDVRLQSMARAVQEVIVPALDPEDGLAAAQAELLLAHLAVIRAQLDHLPRYERLAHRDARRLAVAMSDAAAGGPLTDAAAEDLRTALGDLTPDDSDPAALRAATQRLGAAGEQLVQAVGRDGEAAARSSVLSLAVDAGRASAQRQLGWCDPAGDLGSLLDEWEARA